MTSDFFVSADYYQLGVEFHVKYKIVLFRSPILIQRRAPIIVMVREARTIHIGLGP
jgi:hypothetical protein